MVVNGGLSVYPWKCTKTIHLVRDARGSHNVAGKRNVKEYQSYDYFDAELTCLGWKQVDRLRRNVQSSGLSKRIELVITSPMLRTMQTAVGAFGGENCLYDINDMPLMIENVGDLNRRAVSSLNCPPFLAVELCREHMGIHPCNKRRSIRKYQSLFPAIDFSMIEDNDDIMWKPDIREADEEVANRGMEFLRWLWTRKEKEIAVVSHSEFLFHALSAFGNDCHPSVKERNFKRFANCDLRSVVLIDRISAVKSETLTTNFRGGRRSQGLNLLSMTAEMISLMDANEDAA